MATFNYTRDHLTAFTVELAKKQRRIKIALLMINLLRFLAVLFIVMGVVISWWFFVFGLSLIGATAGGLGLKKQAARAVDNLLNNVNTDYGPVALTITSELLGFDYEAHNRTIRSDGVAYYIKTRGYYLVCPKMKEVSLLIPRQSMSNKEEGELKQFLKNSNASSQTVISC